MPLVGRRRRTGGPAAPFRRHPKARLRSRSDTASRARARATARCAAGATTRTDRSGSTASPRARRDPALRFARRGPGGRPLVAICDLVRPVCPFTRFAAEARFGARMSERKDGAGMTAIRERSEATEAHICRELSGCPHAARPDEVARAGGLIPESAPSRRERPSPSRDEWCAPSSVPIATDGRMDPGDLGGNGRELHRWRQSSPRWGALTLPRSVGLRSNAPARRPTRPLR